MKKTISILAVLFCVSCFAATNSMPILRGLLQSDLNAGGYKITNVSAILDTNGNPISGGSPNAITNAVSGSNATVTVVNGVATVSADVSLTQTVSNVVAGSNCTVTVTLLPNGQRQIKVDGITTLQASNVLNGIFATKSSFSNYYIFGSGTFTNLYSVVGMMGSDASSNLNFIGNTNAGFLNAYVLSGVGNSLHNDLDIGNDPFDMRGSAIISGTGNFNEGSDGSVICGGIKNRQDSSYTGSFLGGGETNILGGNWATIGGGLGNISGFYTDGAYSGSTDGSTVAGGVGNEAIAYAATVPGGFKNKVLGDYGFSAGHQASNHYAGSFVWSDSQGSASDSAPDQFVAVAHGGFYFSGSAINGNGSGLTNLNINLPAGIVTNGGSASLTTITASGNSTLSNVTFTGAVKLTNNAVVVTNIPGHILTTNGFGQVVASDNGGSLTNIQSASLTGTIPAPLIPSQLTNMTFYGTASITGVQPTDSPLLVQTASGAVTFAARILGNGGKGVSILSNGVVNLDTNLNVNGFATFSGPVTTTNVPVTAYMTDGTVVNLATNGTLQLVKSGLTNNIYLTASNKTDELAWAGGTNSIMTGTNRVRVTFNGAVAGTFSNDASATFPTLSAGSATFGGSVTNNNGTFVFGSSFTTVRAGSSGIRWNINGTDSGDMTASAWYPSNDGGTSLGISSRWWLNAFVKTPTFGTVVVSNTITATNGLILQRRATNGNYTVLISDECIENTASSNATVTLLTAVGNAGKTCRIKNCGTGVLTVGTTSSQNIDGATTKVLTAQYSSIVVHSDGAQWWIDAEYGPNLSLAQNIIAHPDTYFAGIGGLLFVTCVARTVRKRKQIGYAKHSQLPLETLDI